MQDLDQAKDDVALVADDGAEGLDTEQVEDGGGGALRDERRGKLVVEGVGDGEVEERGGGVLYLSTLGTLCLSLTSPQFKALYLMN